MAPWFKPDGGLFQALLSDMSYVASLERLGRLLFKRVLWRVPTVHRRLALTFDDGPHPHYTPLVLDILKKHGLPATFFLIGRHVVEHPTIVQRILAEGHEIANHTYSHPLLLAKSRTFIEDEIGRNDDILKQMGARPVFFRPPMGLFSRAVLDIAGQYGYRAVVGDVYPRDPHLPGAGRIARRILSRIRKGSIVILHDGGNTTKVDRSQTAEALKAFIPELQKREFEFQTLSRLADTSTSNGDIHA